MLYSGFYKHCVKSLKSIRDELQHYAFSVLKYKIRSLRHHFIAHNLLGSRRIKAQSSCDHVARFYTTINSTVIWLQNSMESLPVVIIIDKLFKIVFIVPCTVRKCVLFP